MEPTGEIVQEKIQKIFPEAEEGIAILKKLFSCKEDFLTEHSIHLSEIYGNKQLDFFQYAWYGGRNIFSTDSSQGLDVITSLHRNKPETLISMIFRYNNGSYILGQNIFETLGKYYYSLFISQHPRSRIMRFVHRKKLPRLKELMVGLEESISTPTRKAFSLTEIDSDIEAIPDFPLVNQLIATLYPMAFTASHRFLQSTKRMGLSSLIVKANEDPVTHNDSTLRIILSDNIPGFLIFVSPFDLQVIKKYKKIIERIGTDYVLSSAYPEIGIGRIHTLNDKGFYEVYGGPAIRMLDLTKFPPRVSGEIFRQMNYITYALFANGINHGHLHTGNFNIRWLITDGKIKRVIFNPKLAFKTLQEMGPEATITPIVMVRDWDEAKYRYTNLE